MKTLQRWMFNIVLVTALMILVATPVVAFAQSATPAATLVPAFVLEPSGEGGTYIEATMAAGAAKEFTITLGNAGESTASARTFVADAYTLVNGGFGVKQDGEATSGATTWISYPTESLDIASGERVERTLSVNVPADAAPGQYISGIVLQTAEPISVNGTGMLRQVIRKAIAVFITVPGAIKPELTIGQASIKQSTSSNSLLVGLGNTGNILLRPTGTVTLTASNGDIIVSAPIAMGSVYAGTTTSIEIPIPVMLAAGDYSVSVKLVDTENGVNVAQSSLQVTVIENALASPVAAAVSIQSTTVEPILDQSSGSVQFVNVLVALSNSSSPVSSARLTMHVMRDGVLVEDLPLNSSLVVPTGSIEIQQRYIPLNGWETGTYSFTFTLEAVDANSGQTTVLATGSAAATIVVP